MMATFDGFTVALDLQQRSHVRSLYFALVRNGPPPEWLRAQIVAQFDAALATAARRSRRSFTHFNDLIIELAKVGVIDTDRVISLLADYPVLAAMVDRTRGSEKYKPPVSRAEHRRREAERIERQKLVAQGHLPADPDAAREDNRGV